MRATDQMDPRFRGGDAKHQLQGCIGKGARVAEQYIIRKGVFQHVTLEGTSYEIGRMQAEILKATNEGFLSFFTSGQVHPEKHGFATFKQLQGEYEAACPGINDEIQGFADGLGSAN